MRPVINASGKTARSVHDKNALTDKYKGIMNCALFITLQLIDDLIFIFYLEI